MTTNLSPFGLRVRSIALILAMVLSPFTPSIAIGQEPSKTSNETLSTKDSPVGSNDEKALFDSFEKMLTNVRLIGLFTVDGKSMKDLNEETYEIKSVKKLPDDKMWMIAARIKYGKYDVTVPIALTIEWAGKTPVITMDQVAIPGLGTFSARVLFHDLKYAGTWTHDAKGGHLFGRIEKIADSEKEKPSQK